MANSHDYYKKILGEIRKLEDKEKVDYLIAILRDLMLERYKKEPWAKIKELGINLRPYHMAVFWKLYSHRDNMVPHEDLDAVHDAIYDPCEYPTEMRWKAICVIRKETKHLGITIKAQKGVGYYMVVPETVKLYLEG